MSDHSDCTQGSGVTYQKRENDHLFSIILKKDIWEKLSVIDVAFINLTIALLVIRGRYLGSMFIGYMVFFVTSELKPLFVVAHIITSL